MFIVIAYDIRNNRRRTQLHEALKNFGIPVQFSVFECMLEKGDFQRMKKRVRQIIKKKDSVRFYLLCDSCTTKIQLSGVGYILKKEDYYIV